MSFDLGFWWEDQSISPVEAAQKYGAMVEGDTGIADEHPALETFYTDLTSRFPDLAEENFEVSPWAAPLHQTSECVIVSISYSHWPEIYEYLLGVARKNGVTCYDPQSGKVYFPKGRSSATLELSDGSVIDDPNHDDMIQSLSDLSSEDWYVILETQPDWFIQVGFGTAAGVPAGSYALEFKEGAADKHFRAVTEERSRVVDAFFKFLDGESSWRYGFQFYRVSY